MYNVRVNNSAAYQLAVSSSSLNINGVEIDWNLVKVSEGHFHIIHQNKSFNAEVISQDFASKSFTLKINGMTFNVELKDKFDMLLEKLGMKNGAPGKVNNVKAPMPGLIIELRVKEGQSVKGGDALLILEAMKMENVIKSPGDTVVKKVLIKKGDSVEKNQVLIQF